MKYEDSDLEELLIARSFDLNSDEGIDEGDLKELEFDVEEGERRYQASFEALDKSCGKMIALSWVTGIMWGLVTLVCLANIVLVEGNAYRAIFAILALANGYWSIQAFFGVSKYRRERIETRARHHSMSDLLKK